MPELPEVEALADHLRRRAVGLTIGRIDVSALSVLKTFDPPINVLHGQTVAGANRWGKYLGVQVGELHLITHLSRAGWLRWSDKLAAAPLKPGKGPIALRVHLNEPSKPGEAPGLNVAGPPAPGLNVAGPPAPGLNVAGPPAPGLKVAGPPAPGFDLTEAGTQKRLAVWLVDDPAKVPGIAALGPDALSLGPEELAGVLAGNSGRIKTVITDQKVIAGIGNAYSDEILHVAKLSPFATAGKLTDAQLAALHDAMISVLTDAVERSVGQQAATLKGEKRSGLRVHARTGMPCPVCGDTVREVSFADKSFQYCPTCQTGGKVLADRRLSRLLK
jgi:formamidopyrimidine-DNA glycosylase